MAKEADYIKYSIYAILVLSLFNLFKSCSNSSRLEDLDTYTRQNSINTDAKIDSVGTLIITEQVMIDLIKETPAWNTLRIEEISDKERISINALEQKEKIK